MARKGRPAYLKTTVAQKSGTNRVILNTGWTALKRMPECKAGNVFVDSRREHVTEMPRVRGG